MKNICFKKIPKSLLVILIFYHSYLLQYIPLLLFSISKEQVSNQPKIAVLFLTFSSFCVFLFLLFFYRKDLIQEMKIYRKNFFKNIDIGLASWIVGLIIMVIANLILTFVFHSSANNENAVQDYIKVFPWVMGINVCFLAPFNEEIVFRKSLKDVFKNPFLFVISSFLFFGIAHVSGMATSFVDWLYFIPYGALGGAFAFAYYKTDTVFTSMTFHMIHNTLIFLISVSAFLA